MNTARSRIPRFVVVLAALTIIGAGGALTGCVAPADAAAGPAAAVVEEIGDTELNTLTLTPQAVARLGLEIAEVEAGEDGRLSIPYAALIYSHDGETWVYTNPEPEVFVRAAVEVDRIDTETVYLFTGPAPGTRVVTVGAAELYGAEFDTAH